jgi:hypothetical protein
MFKKDTLNPLISAVKKGKRTKLLVRLKNPTQQVL